MSLQLHVQLQTTQLPWLAPHLGQSLLSIGSVQKLSRVEQSSLYSQQKWVLTTLLTLAISRSVLNWSVFSIQDNGNVAAQHYHAGMTPKQRINAQNQWRHGKLQVCPSIRLASLCLHIYDPDVIRPALIKISCLGHDDTPICFFDRTAIQYRNIEQLQAMLVVLVYLAFDKVIKITSRLWGQDQEQQNF